MSDIDKSEYEANYYNGGDIDRLNQTAGMLRDAIDDQMRDVDLYNYLGDKYGDIGNDELELIQNNEAENLDVLNSVYTDLTGETYRPRSNTEQFRYPASFRQGVRRGIYNEVGSLGYYNDIYDNLGMSYKPRISRVITNTISTGLLLNLLYNLSY